MIIQNYFWFQNWDFFILWFHLILNLISFNFNIQSTSFWLFFPIPYRKVINVWKGKKKAILSLAGVWVLFCWEVTYSIDTGRNYHVTLAPCQNTAVTPPCSFFTPQWEIIRSSFSFSLGKIHCKQWSLHDYVFGKYKHSLMKKNIMFSPTWIFIKYVLFIKILTTKNSS